jgi:hypothetical protein
MYPLFALEYTVVVTELGEAVSGWAFRFRSAPSEWRSAWRTRVRTYDNVWLETKHDHTHCERSPSQSVPTH